MPAISVNATVKVGRGAGPVGLALGAALTAGVPVSTEAGTGVDVATTLSFVVVVVVVELASGFFEHAGTNKSAATVRHKRRRSIASPASVM
ncbi:MAG: hypothetical protein NVSMB31_08090 [Vulcanimicrobiaceae bacterium]